MPALVQETLETLSLALTASIITVVCFLSYLIAIAIYDAYFHPLARVPGPRLWSMTQLPFIYYYMRGEWHEKLRSFHDSYGPAVRYTRNDVSFISLEAGKKIYGHRSAQNQVFEKDVANFYRPTPHPHIINSDNDTHKRQRRLLSHAFSDKALSNQEPVMKHYIDLFIDKMTTAARAGETVDIMSWYNFTTFDLIGDLAFGEPFGCLEGGGYHPWVRMVFDSIKAGVVRQVANRLGVVSILPFVTPSKLKKAVTEHTELTRATTMKRINSGNTEREDFMSYILRHNDTDKGMSTEEMAANASILIVAGSETTATILSGVTFQLLRHPEVLRRLTEEIRSSFTSEDQINMSRVNQLSYMLAVFQEGFRIYPPVPAHLARIVPSGGEHIDGFYLPENTSVSVPQWSANRFRDHFRDPDVFDPERWLGNTYYANDRREVVQPFSQGPRNCIGKNLAYIEMRFILARLLWKFDIELSPGCETWDQQKTFTLWEKGALYVQLKAVNRDSV